MKLQETEGRESHCVANFATFVPKTLLYISIENENGCNKVEIELNGVQFVLKSYV